MTPSIQKAFIFSSYISSAVKSCDMLESSDINILNKKCRDLIFTLMKRNPRTSTKLSKYANDAWNEMKGRYAILLETTGNQEYYIQELCGQINDDTFKSLF